jgi:hypothetical protein
VKKVERNKFKRKKKNRRKLKMINQNISKGSRSSLRGKDLQG